MSKSKQPKVGDLIEHICTLNGKFEGKVVQMLSMQFIYETKEGNRRFCMLENNGNILMSLQSKINQRMDILQDWMEQDYHLDRPEVVYEHTLSVSKFWSVLSEEDRDYIQGVQFAIDTKSTVSWKKEK
mgnify:CR=1 FL=1